MENKLIDTKKTDVLMNIKNISWVGKLNDETEEIDFIINELKSLLDEVEDVKEKVKIIKQLQDVEAEKTKRAMHLDNLMIKAMEIEAFRPNNNLDNQEL